MPEQAIYGARACDMPRLSVRWRRSVLGAIEANGFTELSITAATPRTQHGCRDITVTLLIDF
jgi:hypothetical protein